MEQRNGTRDMDLASTRHPRHRISHPTHRTVVKLTYEIQTGYSQLMIVESQVAEIIMKSGNNEGLPMVGCGREVAFWAENKKKKKRNDLKLMYNIAMN